MIEFEYQGTRYQARARRMVKHWHVYLNEVGKEEQQVTEEMLAGELDEAGALKKGILDFFKKNRN
ncbi:MAG: hypothetical protein HOE48_06130 [Candidatus Latescibacteria bacterium]|jgi:hypothetical protein|nr:hypothetical protein [Candidatus Latescibacterota bacterium]